MKLRRTQRHHHHPTIDSSWREVEAWFVSMTRSGQLTWAENAYGLRAAMPGETYHVIPGKQVSIIRPGRTTVWAGGSHRRLLAVLRASMAED